MHARVLTALRMGDGTPNQLRFLAFALAASSSLAAAEGSLNERTFLAVTSLISISELPSSSRLLFRWHRLLLKLMDHQVRAKFRLLFVCAE
jgi:hypothetical protein